MDNEIEFKWRRFEKTIILLGGRWYLLSYFQLILLYYLACVSICSHPCLEEAFLFYPTCHQKFHSHNS
jgi:hypothetical protein